MASRAPLGKALAARRMSPSYCVDRTASVYLPWPLDRTIPAQCPLELTCAES
jgi:hypothetical protein